MMENKNRTESDILGMKQSRFSGEERARMAEERAASVKLIREENAKKQKTSQRKTSSKPSSGIKNEGSRNERVRSSTQQRKKDRKRQNNLTITMLFVAAAALVGVLCVFVLKINSIDVTGTDRYSKESVLSAAGISEGDSMVLVNNGAMSEKIRTALPFVENADIKRQWPDKVSIVIEDAVPGYAVDTGKGYVLLNASLKVLDNDAVAKSETAALLKGLVIQSAVPGQTIVFDGQVNTEELRKLITELENSGVEDISEIDLSSISSIVIDIAHRVEVKLGTLAGAAGKFSFGKEVIERTLKEDTKHIMVVDMTGDKEAYVRAKDDNNVVFSDEPISEEANTEEESTALLTQENAVG